MDIGVLRGLITIVTMVTFLGICWWAYRSRNRERFEQDALLPFADEPELSPVEALRSAPPSDSGVADK